MPCENSSNCGVGKIERLLTRLTSALYEKILPHVDYFKSITYKTDTKLAKRLNNFF